MGADLFFLPRYMNCGSLALPGLKMGSSTMPLLSFVILLNTGLAVVVVVAGVVVVVVVDICSLLCPCSRNINIVMLCPEDYMMNLFVDILSCEKELIYF